MRWFSYRKIDPSYQEVFSKMAKELHDLQVYMHEKSLPCSAKVFSQLFLPLADVHAIILGYEPEESEDISGIAYNMHDYTNWVNVTDPCLQGLYQSIYAHYQGITTEDSLLDYDDLLSFISPEEFPISTPNAWQRSLIGQGVRFINFFPNRYDQHIRDLWRPISQELIKHIVDRRPDIRWITLEDEATAELMKLGPMGVHPERLSKLELGAPVVMPDGHLSELDGFEETRHWVDWLG